MIESVFLFIFMLASLCFMFWWFFLLPAGMATNRGRNAVGWVLVSVLFSPILACLLLWLLGNNPNGRG